MKYNHFTLNDFVLDDHFIKWIQLPDAQTNVFWQDWIETHPEKKALVDEARQMVLALSVPGKQLSEKENEQLWEKINQRRFAQAISISKPKSVLTQEFKVTWLYKGRIAATLTIILVIAAWWIWIALDKSPEPVQFTTHYNEIKNIALPDGSQVTLNANSTLRFSPDWNEQHEREVQLTGEAFFAVTKKPGKRNATFIVRTQTLNIEVLGTQFNVNNRRDKVQVVLQEGKVSLSQSGSEDLRIFMMPGDLVAYTQKDNRVHRKKVNPMIYSSWREEEIIFEEKPLFEIAQVLEDTKGLKVIFIDDSLQNLSFTGTLPNHDVDGFLVVLSKSFGIDVSRKGNQIMIRKK